MAGIPSLVLNRLNLFSWVSLNVAESEQIDSIRLFPYVRRTIEFRALCNLGRKLTADFAQRALLIRYTSSIASILPILDSPIPTDNAR